ncbi:hypothetical protein [Cohnella sp. AR92]|uniref:hypothetical protein n=1 Tax=Cohnella sp. AR92 TaxID=648716 RepID=UPI000F8D40F9|nr:hypothetical protein [Cohnella sp. AR92]RUS44614.1 hypothetical protein ELR57_22795 [Cohnella sp. AR92]
MKHKPNIFREVRDWIETVQSRISDDVYNEKLEIEHKRLEAVYEVLRYLGSLSWVSHQKTRERMEHYLKKADLNAKKTAATFNVSVNAIEVSLKYVSDKVRSLIGKPLSVIEQAQDISTIETGLDEFRKVVASGVPSYGYFLSGIEPYLPKPKYNPKFSLADCTKEISRIGVFAHYAKYVLTQECDQDKLAHLLSLVSSLNGSKYDREVLKLFFNGEFSESDTGKYFKIGEQIEQLQQWLQNQNPYNA